MNRAFTITSPQRIERYNWILEICSTPHTTEQIREIIGCTRGQLVQDLIQLRVYEKPFLKMIEPGIKGKYGWMPVYETLRTPFVQPIVVRPINKKVFEAEAPKTPFLRQLLGYSDFEPEIVNPITEKDFENLRKKHGVWNPQVLKSPKNAVSGNTLSMIE